ncbi:MAG TPA: hypothetical protein VK689_05715, partial [Armatimonadota bacterium]|nr:hypothetical protein [Armatimonadota bacterium]
MRAYSQDERLSTRVTLEPRVGSGRELLAQVKQQAKVQLLLEEEWAETPFAVAAHDLPTVELMRALERLLRARWELVDPYWVLARSPELAALAQQRAEQRLGKQRDHFEYVNAKGRLLKQLVLELTPDQWARLESREKFPAKELTPRQWGLLQHVMDLYRRDPRAPNYDTPAQEAFTGEGVYLQVREGPNGLDQLDFH